MEEGREGLFKIVVIGDSGVGKTSLVERLINGSFRECFTSTIGVDFKTIQFNIDGKDVYFGLWDTAGQERYRSVTKSYFRGAVGAVVVYAIDDRRSFENVAQWIDDFTANATSNALSILIANKSDREANRVISSEEGNDFAMHHKMEYIEASALDGSNVEEAFRCMVILVHEKAARGEFDSFKKRKIESVDAKEDKCAC